jgi:hypothetical protein
LTCTGASVRSVTFFTMNDTEGTTLFVRSCAAGDWPTGPTSTQPVVTDSSRSAAATSMFGPQPAPANAIAAAHSPARQDACVLIIMSA